MLQILKRAGLLLVFPAFVAGIWLLNRIAGITEDRSWSLWMSLTSAAGGYFVYRFFRLKGLNEKICGFCFSLFFIFLQLIGRQYDFWPYDGSYPSAGRITNYLICLLCAALLAPGAAFFASSAIKRLSEGGKNPARTRLSDAKMFFLWAAVLFALWQPYHLAYFPCIAEYDSGYQFWQCYNGLYNASNPLAHTLILGFFYLTGEKYLSVNAGLFALSLLQQVLMACSISRALVALRRGGVTRLCLGLLTAFFGLLPVFGVLSISLTKDVPFYCLVLIQASMLFDGTRHLNQVRRPFYWIRLLIVTFFASHMRTNAIWAMFLIAPALALCCRHRAFRRRMLCFMLSGVLLAFGANESLIYLLKADKPLLRESLNLPIAQLARVSVTHEDAYEDMEKNHSDLVTLPMAYIPSLIDLSKWCWEVDTKNIGRFAGLWAEYLKKYPYDYADSFFMLNRGYWYVWDVSYSEVYGKSYKESVGVLPSRVNNGLETIHEECYLPAFKNWMERMFSANEYMQAPFFRLLLSPALYVWTLLLCLLACIKNKRWRQGMVGVNGLMYLTALMMGPCCIIRYALIFFLLSPVLLCMMLTGREGAGEGRTAR